MRGLSFRPADARKYSLAGRKRLDRAEALATPEGEGEVVAVGHEAERKGAKTPPATPRRTTSKKQVANGAAPTSNGYVDTHDLQALLDALKGASEGDFALRLPARGKGVVAELHAAFNQLAERRAAMEKELARVSRAIGREGRL